MILILICLVEFSFQQTKMDSDMIPLDSDQHDALMSLYTDFGCSSNDLSCPRFNVQDPCPQLEYDQFVERLLCRNGSVLRIGLSTAPIENGLFSSHIGRLTKLEDFIATDQKDSLSGTLPTELARLTDLKRLSLCCNNFFGSLTHIDWSKMTNLADFGIHNNIFNGTIPSTLVQLRSLQKIRVYNNRLSGHMPNISPDVICTLVRDENDKNCLSNCQNCECNYGAGSPCPIMIFTTTGGFETSVIQTFAETSNTKTMEEIDNENQSYTLLYVIIGVIVVVIGLSFVLIGLVLWLKKTDEEAVVVDVNDMTNQSEYQSVKSAHDENYQIGEFER